MNSPIRIILPLLLLATSAVAQTHRYQVIDLGVLSGQPQSTAAAINSAGAVVGSSGIRAFVYRNCTMYDLGILPNGYGATATGINNNGQVSGYSEGSDRGLHAVDWHDGSIHLLLPGNTYQSKGLGISDTGRVVGFEYNGLASDAIGFDDDLSTIVPSDNDATYGWGPVNVAYGANGSGQMIGYRDILTSGNLLSTVLGLVTQPTTQASTANWVRINAPAAFTGWVYPQAINESGAVAGYIVHWVGATSTQHAFLSSTTGATATDLGTPGGTFSQGSALNNARWVVGSGTNASSAQVAFLYDGTTMIDLNTTLVNPTGWQLTSASGINDYNQIVGTGYHNGVVRAYLLNPITSTLPILGLPLPCSISRLPITAKFEE